LHCVFHGIRFKVNEDWVSVIDTLLFLYTIDNQILSVLQDVSEGKIRGKRKPHLGAKYV
jgi:hypothetical protein